MFRAVSFIFRARMLTLPLQGTMFTDGRAPGDLSFDPLNLSADESTLR